MGDSSQDEGDDHKINTVIAARRAFERSEERERQNHGNDARRKTERSYESPGSKYCPCCKDKLSTAILLCNSGLMTVTSQIAVICSIYVATTGLNIVPTGLVAIFLLTCFAVAVFGLCGIIGPIRRTFSNPPLEGAQKAGTNMCILSYMLANIVVLFIFFIALCFSLSFLNHSSLLRDVKQSEIEELNAVGMWIKEFATEEEHVEEWINFQSVAKCCGFFNSSYDADTMPDSCDVNGTTTTDSTGKHITCYEDLVDFMWDNLSLLSGIMGLLFLLQLSATCAAMQLLCCAQKRNQFSEAAEVAVKKLGIVVENAREDVREDEVLIDSDYTSSEEDDSHGGVEMTTQHSQVLEEYDEFNANGMYAEPDSDEDSLGRQDYNITQRSSGPDSSEDDQSPPAGRRSGAPKSSGGTRAATYAQEVVDVVVEGGESDDEVIVGSSGSDE